MADLHRVASVDEIPEGTGKEFVAGDRMIALFHVGDQFFAMDGVCPHAGGPLGQGALAGSIVTCPWHGWQFDVTTGQHCLNANLTHPNFAVHVKGSEIFVELP